MAKYNEHFPGQGLKADLSPMIDLVFLLLIFFMVAANIITFPKDPNIVIPVASDAEVPTLVEGRVVINVYVDGTVKDVEGTTLSIPDLRQRISTARSTNPNARLHLRAHRAVPYK